MKKIILFVIILLIASWIPVSKTDISNLKPIQAIFINKDGDNYIVKTDTDDLGIGKSIKEAVETMKTRCEKLIYLDTAQYLFVDQDARETIDDISQYLKDKVVICIWDGVGEIKSAAQYVRAHRIGIKIKDYFSNVQLPVIPDLTTGQQQKNSE